MYPLIVDKDTYIFGHTRRNPTHTLVYTKQFTLLFTLLKVKRKNELMPINISIWNWMEVSRLHNYSLSKKNVK